MHTYVSIQQFQECGLSCTIRTHKSQPRVQIDAEFKILVNVGPIVAVLEAHVLHHDDGGRHFPAAREVEVKYFITDHLLRQPLGDHFRQRLLLALGLPGQLGRSVTEPGDVVLHVIDLVLFPVVLLHLVLQELHSRADETVVVTRVVFKAFLIDVDDVCAYSIQEILMIKKEKKMLE